MGARVGIGGTVFAFEPHPALFERLAENVEQCRESTEFGEVKLYQAAVGDRSRPVRLVCPDGFEDNDGIAHVAENGTATAGIEIQVPGVTLDEVLGKCGIFSLAKIDVEGHELAVLKGGEHIFRDRVTHVIFEEHRGHSSEVCALLVSFGFSLLQFSWSMRGLCIGPIDGRCKARSYEAPNYIATKDPQDVFARCCERGWHVLRRR
jgi:FkbM family methyltransferase